jgi:hypothetical protein
MASLMLLAAVYIYTLSGNKAKEIALQSFERVSLNTATGNITERFDLVREAIHRAMESPKSVLLGVGYIEDRWNPHNVIAESLLLFGLLPTLSFVSYCGYVCWRLPIVLFALVGSLVEILFFTSTYDFLFFILLIVNVHALTRKSVQHMAQIPASIPNPEIT